MNKQKLKITILLLSLLQMGPFFMAPIMGEIIGHFPLYSPSVCQLIMTFPNLIVVITSIIVGKLEPYITKKHFMIFASGAILVASLGLFTFHDSIYLLFAFAGLLGIGVGIILPLAATIISIYFHGEEQAQVYGYQNSITNVGGMLMSLLCGGLASIAWYYGFLTPMLIVPAFIMSFVAIPNDKGIKPVGEKPKLPLVVFRYCAIIFVFLILFNTFPTNLAVFIGENKLGDSSLAGIASAVLLLGGTVGGVFFNKLNKVFGEKVISVGFLNLGLGLIITSYASSTALLFVGTFVGGCSISLLMSRLSMDIAINTVPQVTPIAMGLLIAFNNCGGFVSPTLFGLLNGTVGSRYLIVGVAAIIVAVILTFIFTKSKKESE